MCVFLFSGSVSPDFHLSYEQFVSISFLAYFVSYCDGSASVRPLAARSQKWLGGLLPNFIISCILVF